MKTSLPSEDTTAIASAPTSENLDSFKAQVDIVVPQEVLKPYLIPAYQVSRHAASICIAASGLLFCFVRELFPNALSPLVVLVVLLLVIILGSGYMWWNTADGAAKNKERTRQQQQRPGGIIT